MGILSDVEIRKLCVEEEMISPFADIEEKKQSKKDGKMSYGLDGSGYDIRIQNSYEVLKSNIQRKDIDPKSKDDSVYERKSAINGVIVVPAHSYVRVVSVEKFKMPSNVKALCYSGKSTYTRNAVVAVITPIDEGYEGYITFSVVNHSHVPQRIYANEGIAQLVFHRIEGEVETSYADRDGKYMDSKGIQGSKV